MTEKLRWIFKLMRSKSFVILTDKESVLSVPLEKMNEFQSVLVTSAQSEALIEFRNALNDVIKEHKDMMDALLTKKKTFSRAKSKVANGKKS